MKSDTTTILYVNPVQRVSAQGRHNQMYTYINKTGELVPSTSMNKTRETGVGVEYSFPYNYNKGKLETGLDRTMGYNPFKNLDPKDIIDKYSLNQDWYDVLQRIVKQDELKLQTYYEVLDNVPYDYYTNIVKDNKTIFNWSSRDLKVEPTFMQRFKIVLYDRPNRFDSDSSRGRLAIQLIKNHPSIAANRSLMNNSIHSWYISEENEAERERSKKRERIQEANFYMFDMFRNQTEFRAYQLAILLTYNSGKTLIKGEVSFEKVKDVLGAYLEEGTHQLENVDKFVSLVKLTSTPEGLAKLKVQYLIQQALNTNIMSLRDGFYVWNSKSGVPNMYKHSDYSKLLSLFITEMDIYNPKDNTVTNWYGELIKELKEKGIKTE